MTRAGQGEGRDSRVSSGPISRSRQSGALCEALGRHGSDGGYDIVLLERAGDDETRQVLVECKRYAPDRSVGVGIVRQLLGVQLVLGIPLAKRVTSAHFTESAVRTAQHVCTGESGYQLELVDIQRLTEMLGIYRNNSVDLVSMPVMSWPRRRCGRAAAIRLAYLSCLDYRGAVSEIDSTSHHVCAPGLPRRAVTHANSVTRNLGTARATPTP